MNDFNIWDAIVGSGLFMGVLSFWLNWRNHKTKKDIDWYDRAINEIERLEERLSKLLIELESYKSRLDESERKLEEKEKIIVSKEIEVNGLEKTIEELKIIIDDLRKKIKEMQEGGGEYDGE